MPRRSKSPLARAQAHGSQAAAREHARLRTEQSGPIDIFRIIEEAGIWLMFQPMHKLFGAYLREGGGAGIIINANHPLSVRRFTAAHEYGHHVLDHGSMLDDEHDIHSTNTTRNFEEVAAQAFAANFLMPLQLVNTMLRQMGLAADHEDFTATQVYLLSLNLGSSYPATINQLQALHKLSRPDAQSLKAKQPRTLKATIGRGRRPADPRADAWQANVQDSGRTLYPKVDDMLYLSLPELPSSGYIWVLEGDATVDLTAAGATHDDQEALLALEASTFEGSAAWRDPAESRGSSTGYGAGGIRHLAFRALRPGEFRLRLQNRRPWETSDPVQTYELDLRIMPAGTGGTEQGLSTNQWPWLTEAA